jgi:UDP-N-acetylmuramoylalanine--D-glutamate ligase
VSGRYLVVGLARSGIAACEAIARVWPGSEIVAADARPDADTSALAALGIECHLGGGIVPVDGLTALVKSPGVPGEIPQVAAARAAGVPVWSEVELAARMLPNPIAGVTGTNGKTTTTHLVGSMLRSGGLECEVAGNVGRALSELAGRIGDDVWIACELSSFQLEDIDRLHCRVAVVLNLTPDHLDRHGSMDAYVRAKLRILENQAAGDTAVLNGDDPLLRAATLSGGGERVWFTAADRGSIDWEHARLRGEHNLENALAVAAAARAAGVSAEAIDAALREFHPPPHRLETVASGGGVEWVNDSKATNPDATIKALTAFDAGLHLILGGSLKGASFDALAQAVASGPVACSYLIGAAADALADALAAAGAPYRRCETLERAVQTAAARAKPGDTVLLSPACASFDQFRDYEHRGDRFRELAREAAQPGTVPERWL